MDRYSPDTALSAFGRAHSTFTWNGQTAYTQLSQRAPVLATISPGPWGPRDYRIRLSRLGGVEICETKASAHNMRYIPRQGVSSPHGICCLQIQLHGSTSIRQGANHTILDPGDFVLFDPRMPFEMFHPASTRHAVLVFPQRLMKMPPVALSGLTLVRVPGDRGLARSVSPFLEEIVRDVEDLCRSGESWSDLFFGSVIGMITAVYIERAAELKWDRQGPRHAMLQEIRAYIEANLWDPNLDPRQIAKAHHICVRHLHSLFSQQGTTVSGWIRQRRLEECRDELCNPAFAWEPVASIAARHGFLDAAHFSRLFRASFHETPSGFRSRMLTAVSQAVS